MNPPTPTHHAVLISEHPMPCITPLLDPKQNVQHVTLIHGVERKIHAQRQAGVISKYIPNVRIQAVRDAYDLESLREDFERILPNDQPIAINITGGSKMMTLAAYQHAQRHNHRTYYIHLHHDTIHWLDSNQPPQAIEGHIGVKDCLIALGIHQDQAKQQAYSEAALQFAQQIAQSNKLQQQLNELSQLTHQFHPAHPPLTPQDSQKFANLIQALKQASILHRIQGKIHLDHPQATLYLAGGWLELHTAHVLQSLQVELPRLHDISQGILIHQTRGEQNLINELDIALIHNNALHVIECKTGNMNKKNIGSDSEKMIYKLDMLRDLLGGIRGRALLISLKDLPPSVHQRAEAHHHIISGSQSIIHLRSHLKRWLTQ